MPRRFVPPPGWPPVPEDWTPPPGWQPDPTWPPAPENWVFYQEDNVTAAFPTSTPFPDPGATTPLPMDTDRSYPPPSTAPLGSLPPTTAPLGSAPVGSAPGPAKPTRPWLIPTAAGVIGLLVGVGIGITGDSGSSADAARPEPAPAPTVTVDPTEAERAELDQRGSDLEARSAELDQRSADLDAREEAITGQEAAIAEGTIPGSGTFLVGTDIQPGTYVSDDNSTCYWARLSGTSGEFGDIIANDNVTGRGIVTIAPTDVAFTTTRCSDWTLQP